jgi:hypothetical protein
MHRWLYTLLLLLLATAVSGCDALRNIRGDEKEHAEIRAALNKYLQKRGDLKLDAMDMNILEFNTDRDRADITVDFHAKQGGGVMRVVYHLERTNGVWEVTRSRSEMGGNAAGAQGTGQPALPAGHPPVDSGGSAAPQGQTPKP